MCMMRKRDRFFFTLALICAVMLLPLAVQGQKQSQRGVEVVPDRLTAELWLDRQAPSAYEIGESLQLSFRTSVDAYVTIYSISPDGQATRLFPNRYQQDNSVRGQKTLQIPARGYKLQVTGPPGAARIELYATTDAKQSYRHSAGVDYERVSERKRQNMASATQSLPGKSRAMVRADFQIVAPPPQAWQPDEDFVDYAFQSAIGRPPTYSERSAALRSLSSAPTETAVSSFLQNLLSSDERFVRSAYLALLGREADSSGLQDYLRKLSTRQMSRDEVVQSILSSDEFSKRRMQR